MVYFKRAEFWHRTGTARSDHSAQVSATLLPMERREFLLSLGACALSLPVSPRPVQHPRERLRLNINGDRVNRRLSELSRFGRTAEDGISRVAYSEADCEGRAYAISAMEEAGLDVSIDVAGNVVGRRDGQEPSLPPILFGSHIDSVPHGGNYDGQVGSMAAVEVVHTMSDAGWLTRHPLEVILFPERRERQDWKPCSLGRSRRAES